MACWRDDNKVLSHKIASMKAKLLEAFSQKGNGNKIQGQDNDLDLSQEPRPKRQLWEGEQPQGCSRKSQEHSHCQMIQSFTHSYQQSWVEAKPRTILGGQGRFPWALAEA
ncbi:hypothetical protein DSO57_1031758 [Entomophthora muscae]|uniref:Uncharacterized protein n=1 Tax=Entomophthora muscae TaxID=34485 RepID=A0ACC2U9K8_9FUNG|nr:hypothetical protein DSO57_1031758 [Entomophthora muscae]